MADITMSLDDTLELDAVIKEWNDPSNIVEDSNDKFNMSGFYTGTRVLDPQESGTHTIKVNGQELSVKVNESNTIPDSGDLHSNNDVMSVTATDGDSITKLSDQTGNGFDLSAGTTSSSTYDADLINGNPGLDMPSGSQLFETATDIPQPATIFFVGAVTSTGASNDQPFAGGVDSISEGAFGEKNGYFRLLANNYPNVTASDTSLHIFSGMFDGTNSILRIDGNEFSGVNAGSDNIVKLGLNGVDSGGRSPGLKAGQMLVYPQDKSAIFSDVEQFLADRWNFTL